MGNKLVLVLAERHRGWCYWGERQRGSGRRGRFNPPRAETECEERRGKTSHLVEEPVTNVESADDAWRVDADDAWIVMTRSVFC